MCGCETLESDDMQGPHCIGEKQGGGIFGRIYEPMPFWLHDVATGMFSLLDCDGWGQDFW